MVYLRQVYILNTFNRQSIFLGTFSPPAVPVTKTHKDSPPLARPRPNHQRPPPKMVERKNSISRLLPSTSIPRFGKEKARELPAFNTSMRLPRRRTSVLRVTFDDDSSDSEQHSPNFYPTTTAASSARLLRLASKTGLRSLETASSPSLRPTSKYSLETLGSPGLSKNSFRSKAPKLDERVSTSHLELLSNRETITPPYEEQFRRRRGDPLHRLGPSVPYMQAYGPTSLQWWVLRCVE